MLFWEDLKAKADWCYGAVTAKTLLKTCLTDGTPAMLWYRLMQGCRRWKLEPAAMLFNKINAAFCQCIIGRGANFGPGFVLIHSQGVVINGNVQGGSGVKIEHQVTIGAEKRQTPVVGNDVFIGAGAKIIGAVRIGDRARVGANAVVVHDVPADATVGGIPAKVLKTRTNAVVDEWEATLESEAEVLRRGLCTVENADMNEQDVKPATSVAASVSETTGELS